jgi:L-alanine-DL-glutamate epimerase-like enolase superfamily enzyme
MTAVATVRARPVVVALASPTAFSTRQVVERHYALVEVVGDDGISGVGFCYAGHRGSQLVAEAVASLLAPVVVGQDAHRVEGIWDDLYREVILHGRAGAVMRALSAVDIALWDRNARAAGLPLHKLLGAMSIDSVPAYASGGYYVEGKGPDRLADEVGGYVDGGFGAVKIKVGRSDDLHAEEARIAAVRARIGGDCLLMLDANNAWSDLPSALRFMRMAEQYDPYWIEEPFSPDDLDNHARLARATPVPVATGEIEAGRWRFKEILDRDAAAILQADACVCGGITEFRHIAANAASFGVAVCPHWFADVHAPLVASIPTGRLVEVFPNLDVFNFAVLIDRPLAVRAGQIVLPTEPGLGFGFDPQAVEHHAVGPWTA